MIAFPEGSVRAAVQSAGDLWGVELTLRDLDRIKRGAVKSARVANRGPLRDEVRMITSEGMRRAGATPAQRIRVFDFREHGPAPIGYV